MQVTYDIINTLDEMQFIEGTVQDITFTVYDETGTPLDLETSTCAWNMSRYGYPDVVELSKSGIVTGVNTFVINILSGDTNGLSGKFIHQPVITNGSSIYIPAQGVITITPKIQ